jgi:formylglycine-generating enzyme required for sulfatase activity
LNPIYTFAQIANDMVSIPSGKLIVSTEYRSTEKFIDNFFMDRFEVTQESYQKIIGYNPSFF